VTRQHRRSRAGDARGRAVASGPRGRERARTLRAIARRPRESDARETARVAATERGGPPRRGRVIALAIGFPSRLGWFLSPGTRTFLRPSREATGATAAFLATVTGALTATAEPRKVEVMAAIVYVCVFLDGCEECGIGRCSWPLVVGVSSLGLCRSAADASRRLRRIATRILFRLREHRELSGFWIEKSRVHDSSRLARTSKRGWMDALPPRRERFGGIRPTAIYSPLPPPPRRVFRDETGELTRGPRAHRSARRADPASRSTARARVSAETRAPGPRVASERRRLPSLAPTRRAR